jgi:ABC-2 type transport system permease protein
MFLSGSLFPLSGLPGWLSVLTRLNPLTYVVQPMRHIVLSQLNLNADERARLMPVIEWFGWPVPVILQLLTVLVVTTCFIGLAVLSFRKTE